MGAAAAAAFSANTLPKFSEPQYIGEAGLKTLVSALAEHCGYWCESETLYRGVVTIQPPLHWDDSARHTGWKAYAVFY